MKSKFDRKTAALVLFGAALLLLIANLVVGIVEDSSETLPGKKEIKGSEIDSVYLFSLYSFGISKNWITERKNSKINKSYFVKVPTDLSIPVILVELNSNFMGSDVKIISEEKNFGGETETKLSLGNKVKLISKFSYDDKIHRRADTISFVLKDYKLNDSNDSLMLNIPEPFSPLLKPSMQNFDISKFIAGKKKAYSILLDDNITEIKYRLQDNYSENRIKATLFTIIKTFSNAAFFVVDDKSDLYNSDVFKLIKNELDKRNIKFLKLNNLANLQYENDVQIKNDFDNLMKNMEDGESLILVVDYEGFENLIPEIKRFRKIGYKIVHPSLQIRDNK